MYESIVLEAHWVEGGFFWNLFANAYVSDMQLCSPEPMDIDPHWLPRLYDDQDIARELRLLAELISSSVTRGILIRVRGVDVDFVPAAGVAA